MHSPVETLYDGLTQQWLYDRRIVVFVADIEKIITRAGIDAYLNGADLAMGACPSDRPYLALQHYVGDGIPKLTPYAQARTRAVGQKYAHVKGFIANVLKPSPLIMLGRMFIERTLSKDQPYITHRIFFNYDEALRWLETKLPPEYQAQIGQAEHEPERVF